MPKNIYIFILKYSPWETAEEPHAPFDQEFFIIINLAVGGTAGYFPDGVGGKPWQDSNSNSVNQFYAAKNQWFPTWTKPFQIDSVKVWSLDFTQLIRII